MENQRMLRGAEREKNLEKESYFNNEYFSLTQLCSFAHQIHDIYKLQPENILEFGIGNGFTSTYLKRSGFTVTTVDINNNLNPDICSSINEIEKILVDEKFDLIVCCEVLEHMPFEEFEKSISIFSNLGKKLYLTMPNYNRNYGISGFLRIPKFGIRSIDFSINIPIRKKLDKEHFWEINSSKFTTIKSINHILQKYYKEVSYSHYRLNPYHISFFGS